MPGARKPATVSFSGPSRRADDEHGVARGIDAVRAGDPSVAVELRCDAASAGASTSTTERSLPHPVERRRCVARRYRAVAPGERERARHAASR